MLVDQRRSRSGSGRHRVTVLGSFTATAHGDPVPLGPDARRVAAYLAVHRGAHHHGADHRTGLAAALWPGVPADTTHALLDELLASLTAVGLLDPQAPVGDPALAPDVEVDLDEAMALVRALAGTHRPGDVPDDLAAATALLRGDVLPDWPEAWLAVERERFRQIRLNAVEELTATLSAAGRHREAVALAEDLVRTAPSRETARRALIEAHLAQGEIAEAVAQYDEYQELLRSSVGAPPAFGLEGLLPPVPAWPVLRVRRPTQRIAMSPPGLRAGRTAPRRLVSGGSVPGTTR
jgi:DNA-binding SARP family transcriptional activator